MRSAAVLLLLPLVGACGSTTLAEDPERATIVYQRGTAGSAGRTVARIVLTSEASSPHLAESAETVLARRVPPEEMVEILNALEAAGLADLPPSSDPGGDPVPRSVTIESGGRARTWVGRLDRLDDDLENLAAFARVERTLVAWSRSTSVQTRTH